MGRLFAFVLVWLADNEIGVGLRVIAFVLYVGILLELVVGV